MLNQNEQTPTEDPQLTQRTPEPKGVIRKNIKMFVYLGAIALLIVASLFSSKKKTPNATAKGSPPQPFVQDNTANNVADLQNQLTTEKQKQQQDQQMAAALAAAQTPAQQLAANQYAANGQPTLPPPQPGQPQNGQAQLSPEQQQMQQLAGKEREIAFNSRFASNLVYNGKEEEAPQTRQAQDTSETEEPDGNASGGAVPSLPTETTVRASSTRVTDKVTKAPSAYTQASLIKKLETEGIGRPSTYPETLKKIIVTRKYVNEQKRKLAPTELGKLLAASLTGHFSFNDYTYTRDLEQHLDDIASGKVSYGQVLSDLDTKLNSEIGILHLEPSKNLVPAAVQGEILEEAGPSCPKCKEGTVRKPRGQTFFGCSRYKEGCNYNVNTHIAGKTITEMQATTLITKGRVGPVKGFTSKTGKPFEASLICTAESNWKTVFDFGKKV